MKTYHPYELFFGWRLNPSNEAVAKLQQEIDAGRLVTHTVDNLGNVEFAFADGQDECRHRAAMEERRAECERRFAGEAV